MGLFDLFRKQKQVIGKPNETLSQPDILPESPPIPQEARFKPGDTQIEYIKLTK